MTDLGYLVTALWESAAVRGVIRQWSRRRYRDSGATYDQYIAHAAEYGGPLHDALSALSSRPRRILDVSTGTGYAARVARTRFPLARVYACDLSLSMLTRAHEHLPEVPLICGDSGSLPLRDGAIDLVILHNAPPPLKELARITAPGGSMVLCFSAAGRLPAWLPEQIVRRLQQYGLDARWTRAGRGLYVFATRHSLENIA